MQLENGRAPALWAVILFFVLSQCLAEPLCLFTRSTDGVSVPANEQSALGSVHLKGLKYCTTSREISNTGIGPKVTIIQPNKNNLRRFRPRAFPNLNFRALRLSNRLPPTPVASAALTAFYEGVTLLIANGDLQSAPNPHLFTIAYGAFRLTVSSLGTPVLKPVLRDWCSLMAEWASRGWTQLYDVYLVDEATGFTMAVSFYLANAEYIPHQLLPSKRSSSPPSLDRRADPPLTPIKFTPLSYITPVQVAAAFLEDFYDLIAWKIETGTWSAQGLLHSVIFARWNFRLSFFCYAEPVPWDFIQGFAIHMSEMAVRGWTGAYEATYEARRASGIVFVSVKMMLA
ncbi:MAG: hypothetical protein Q9191_002382 [Dirinaria sp. TL-2023a]